MSLTYEKLEGNMAELTITVPADDFVEACKEVYNRSKNKFQLDGFRKGHVPQAFIEKAYGPAVFYEEAANDLMNKTYYEEIKDIDLEIVSNPEISIAQLEKGKDFIYKAKVATKPPVELGDVTKIEIEKVNVEVTDEDIEKEIEQKLKANATTSEVTDRAAKEGDEVKINFEGFVDDVAFEGGKGEDYPLKLGSGTFIPGFEDQIVGHNIGDKFDVNVTFPEEYQAEDLAGKPAVFKTEILGIKETIVPELDDEYVSDTTDFETVDEFKEDIKKTVTERKEKQAKHEKEEKAIAKLVELSTVELPEPMIKYQQERMIDQFGQQLMYQGMNLEQYLNMTGQTRDDMRDQVRPEAEKTIKNSLVIEAVADAQGFDVTEDEVEAEMNKMAEQYKMEIEKIKEFMGEDQIESLKHDIRMNKAIEYIASQAKEV